MYCPIGTRKLPYERNTLSGTGVGQGSAESRTEVVICKEYVGSDAGG